TLRQAKYVAKAVQLCVRTHNLSFTHHVLVAPLPPRDQQRWLAKAERDGMAVAELRRAIRGECLEEKLRSNPLPEGKYRVLYADPPWQYSDQLIAGYGAAEHHFPTLSIDELCALKVGDLAAENSVLFLWATIPILPESLKVVEAWGFTYKTMFIWDK